MARITIRKVKGIPYYYLDETFKEKGKWVKESIYFGNKHPDRKELVGALEELKRKCLSRSHNVVVPPLTEHIAGVLAQKLESARQAKIHFLRKLSSKQREEFTHRERITFITESNAIEGSSLTYHATEEVIEQKKFLKKKEKKYVITGMGREEQEALNLNECLDRYDKYLQSNTPPSEKMVLQQHFVLLQKINGYEKYQGIYRPVNVYIRGSTHEFPEPEQVPRLMKELLEWYHNNDPLMHPVELASKFHTRFTSIHPFADGNGRMARLLMNYILQQHTFPFTNIPLRRRQTYMRTQAAANTGNHKPFVKFLAQEIIDQHTKPKTPGRRKL